MQLLRILAIGSLRFIQDGSVEPCSNQTKSDKWAWQSLATQVASHLKFWRCSHLVPNYYYYYYYYYYYIIIIIIITIIVIIISSGLR